MILYNPKYKKIYGTINKLISVIVFLLVLSAIGTTVFLIVKHYAWYFSVINVVVHIILFIVISKLRRPSECINIDENPKLVLEPEEKIINRVVDDKARGGTFGYSYRGIHRGIAVCACDEFYKPENIQYSVAKAKTVNQFDGYNNMRSQDIGILTVKCTCGKCGEVYSESFSNVPISYYNDVNKSKMFSSVTTKEITSGDYDMNEYVNDIYERDIKQYKTDKLEYDKYVKKASADFEASKKSALEAIQKCKAMGYYEKDENGNRIN